MHRAVLTCRRILSLHVAMCLGLCPCAAPVAASAQAAENPGSSTLAPPSRMADKDLLDFLYRYRRALKAEEEPKVSAQEDILRQAEIVPPTAKEAAKTDPRKAKLIEQGNQLAQDGTYVLSDRQIVTELEELLEKGRFQDTPQTQEMIEVLGQRYGLTTLRIPSGRDYKNALRELRAWALIWHYLHRNRHSDLLQIFRWIPDFRHGMDPRIIFDIYLGFFGQEQGKKILQNNLAKLDVLADMEKPVLNALDEEMVIKLFNFWTRCLNYSRPRNIWMFGITRRGMQNLPI